MKWLRALGQMRAAFQFWRARRKTRKGMTNDERLFGRPSGALYQLLSGWFQAHGDPMPQVEHTAENTAIIQEDSWRGAVAYMIQWDALMRDDELAVFQSIAAKMTPMGMAIQQHVLQQEVGDNYSDRNGIGP